MWPFLGQGVKKNDTVISCSFEMFRIVLNIYPGPNKIDFVPGFVIKMLNRDTVSNYCNRFIYIYNIFDILICNSILLF